MKIGANLTSTASDILKKISMKLQNTKPEEVFDPKTKLLKVLNLCDYFLDSECAIGLSQYITDCIKNEKIPDLLIVNNPFIDLNLNSSRRRSSSLNNIQLSENDFKELRIQKDGNYFNYSTNLNSPSKSFLKSSMTIFDKVDAKKNDTASETYEKLLKSSIQIVNNTNEDSLMIIKNLDRIDSLSRKQTNVINKSTSEKNISISFVNQEIIKFSDFKGLRCRNQSDITKEAEFQKSRTTNQLKITPSCINTNDMISTDELDLNNIIINSIKKKLKVNSIIQASNEDSSLDVDVDRLIKERKTRARNIICEKTKNYVLSGKEIIKKVPNNDSSIASQNSNCKRNRDFKIDNYINLMNTNINIRTISRLFSIKLHMAKFKDNFLKEIDINLSHGKFLHLEFDVQIFCGKETITNNGKIFWKGIAQEANSLINQRIYFNIKYKNLPLFSSLIIKVKTVVNLHKKQKDKKSIEKKTIAWMNFRLFDHLNRLKTGIHKFSLWDTKFLDDSYFSYAENYKENTGEIFFELESFMRPVEYVDVDEDTNLFIPTLNSISAKDKIIIEKILNKSPFEDLTIEDKEVIWRNRTILVENPVMIPMIFSCIDKTNLSLITEIKRLIKICKPVAPIQAIKLLSGAFLDNSIRKFAVYSLQQVSHLEIKDFLLQLVQSLKHEVYHNSHLALYLLKLAIKYPLTIGHQLFWNLKAEMYNANVQQRFGLYLQIFLTKIGPDIRRIFEDELWLINKLLKIADIGFIKNKTKEEINETLNENLLKINNEFCGRSISIPYNFKLRIKGIKAEKCKFMKSKKKPLWIVFEGIEGEDIYVMFKKGDDLRQDIITLQLFKVMHNLWFSHGIRFKMSIYNVISTGYFQGMLEIVTDSETLATVHKLFGAYSFGFSDKPLKDWMKKNITKFTEKDYVNNFLLSCAAYCVATFVLGIGDRHNDNIMIKKNGEFFHIDFGHFLGHFKYKCGFKRERAPFVFTGEFCNVLGGDKSDNFKKFKELCIKSYQILRQNVELLIIMLNTMLCIGIPELTNKSIKFLESSLSLKLSDSEAEKYLLEKLDSSLNAFSTKLNFAFHLIANK